MSGSIGKCSPIVFGNGCGIGGFAKLRLRAGVSSAGMKPVAERRWRHILPWIVSAALLVYVFGWATEWRNLLDAMSHANVPLFLIYVTCDRLAFFVVWTLLQGAAMRRFVVHVPMTSVIAVRGGSELLRAVSNPLSDAAFFLGITQLTGGRIDAVLAAALVPAVCHFVIMLLQMTLALPFLEGGLAANRDVLVAVSVMWTIVLLVAAAIRISGVRQLRWESVQRIREWLERFPLRALRPFFLGFAALAVFDVVIQYLASQAFGVRIDWTALTARIPLVYLSFVIPTLGNFGTREIAWAELFAEFGTRDELVAYAFSVNAIFLVLNVIVGFLFLRRALDLVAEVRRAGRAGLPIPRPAFHDPTDQ